MPNPPDGPLAPQPHASGASEGRRVATWGHRVRCADPDTVLVLAVLGLFLANLVVSLALPTPGIWVSDRANGYRLHLFLMVMGIHLLYPPILVGQSLALADPRQLPPTESLVLWCLAVTAMAVVGVRFTGLPAWRRAVYAYLIGLQVSAFAAVHWSMAGN